jgi:nicotinamide-nucleotide amidase
LIPELVRSVLQQLVAAQWTLGLAESCTGGMISARITNEAGASAVFRGTVVCYANEVKTALLGVRSETLSAFGAVSEETAREKAMGAQRILNVNVSLAITGIAGPAGGTKEKPIGTIWIAIATPRETNTQHLLLPGDRAAIREAASVAALSFLNNALLP